MKRTLALLFVLALLVSCVFSVSAQANDATLSNGEEIIITPMAAYISSAATSLYIYPNTGYAEVSSIFRGYSGTTTRVVMEMVLQKQTALFFWTAVFDCWYKDQAGYKLDYTGGYAYVGKGTYRTKTTFTAYSGSKSEKKTVTSKSVSYTP